MDKLIIAIDFSMSSTGVCFLSGNKVHYLNVLSKRSFTAKKIIPSTGELIAGNKVLSSLKSADNLSIVMTDREPISSVKSTSLSIWQHMHLNEAFDLSKIVCDEIISIHDNYFPEHNKSDTIICLENYMYSMGATDSLVQVIENTAYLKYRLFNCGYKTVNIRLTTAPEIKKYAGSGDYDKYQMFKAFLMIHEPKIKDSFKEILRSNKMDYYSTRTLKKPELAPNPKKKDLLNYEKRIRKYNKTGGQVVEMEKPVDDIVDSYFLACLCRDRLIKLPVIS